MSRFDFPIPYGWFFIGSGDEVKAGEIRRVRCFARDLMLWRDMSGELHLQDANCPHLGANIAVGGKVKGNLIECPFHNWRFDGSGKLVEIPYSDTLNEKACLGSYPLREHYGHLYAWYHPARIEPTLSLPVVPELETGEYVGPFSKVHDVKTCIQEMSENTVDSAHFPVVHKSAATKYENVQFEGTSMIVNTVQHWPSSQGPVEGRLDVVTCGIGFSVSRYKTLIDVCLLTSGMPVERDFSRQLFQVYYRNPTRDEKIDRVGQAFYKEVNRQLGDDIPIWENKVYHAHPKMCPNDGPIGRFRKWAAQFYVA
jgi:phenylpropionate dioxygenase-like ring-hydroxylating dioxygenase large terminal subunit